MARDKKSKHISGRSPRVGEVLTFTGESGWAPAPAPESGGTPGGSTTQVQYNNAGSFAGDAGLTYDATTNVLSVGEAATPGTVGGPAQTGATGVAFSVTGGDTSFSGGTGGTLTLRGGVSSTGAGGLVIISGSAAAGVNTAGGSATVSGGNGNGSGNGGSMNCIAGNSTSGIPGSMNFTAGRSGSGISGGAVSLTAGQNISTGPGGTVNITAGAANGVGASAVGGAVNISGGNNPNPGSGTGGPVLISAGANEDSGDTAHVQIAAGSLRLVGVPTGTTVGAAGGASALPANPTGYLTVRIDGTDRKIPYYAT